MAASMRAGGWRLGGGGFGGRVAGGGPWWRRWGRRRGSWCTTSALCPACPDPDALCDEDTPCAVGEVCLSTGCDDFALLRRRWWCLPGQRGLRQPRLRVRSEHRDVACASSPVATTPMTASRASRARTTTVSTAAFPASRGRTARTVTPASSQARISASADASRARATTTSTASSSAFHAATRTEME